MKKIIIGEIKYTNNEETAKQGLKELIEYCQLVKYKGEYIQDDEIEIIGLLLLDKIELLSGDLLHDLRIKKNELEWEWEELLTGQIKD